MANDKAITQGLFEILSTSLPVAWPTVDFDPPAEGADRWLEVRDFPNEPRELGMGNDALVEFRGLLQVSIHWQSAKGSEGQRRLVAAIELAETIMGQYSKGTDAGPVKVSRRPWRSAPIEDSRGVFIPVTIPYRGIISQT